MEWAVQYWFWHLLLILKFCNDNARSNIIFQCLRNGKKFVAVSNICSVCTASQCIMMLSVKIYLMLFKLVNVF